MPAGVCELITVICQVTLPLLVRELLSLLEENPSQQVTRDGMVFAVAIFAVLVLNAFGNHRHRHLVRFRDGVEYIFVAHPLSKTTTLRL